MEEDGRKSVVADCVQRGGWGKSMQAWTCAAARGTLGGGVERSYSTVATAPELQRQRYSVDNDI